ncbi:MAG: tRNA pseudouridine(55) synthase TruB [Bacteroidetes bacterium]|nr:tRNA pseudouridine(55) synthase TruB [Bacteroidota bacterium]
MITKGTIDFSTIDFHSGEAILIDKPSGWSSFKVVYKIRQAIHEKKIGHAGTLDPLATGLLIICTGKKTKEISKFQDFEKTYSGTILLGKTSASMDLESSITESKPVENITADQILKTRDSFLGNILQTPPMFSAVKMHGKSLYKLARKGKTIEREPREVVIHKFELKRINLPEIEFEIVCSKGTYIRAIANDFGEKLGCGGLLSSLRRTKIGNYSVDDAWNVSEFISEFKIKTEKLVTENP